MITEKKYKEIRFIKLTFQAEVNDNPEDGNQKMIFVNWMKIKNKYLKIPVVAHPVENVQ